QNFDFAVRSGERLLYEGDTYFGFFTKAALAQQVGIREGKPYQPTESELGRGQAFAYPADGPFPDRQLRMIDDVELLVPDGGPHGLGFIQGRKRVDPNEWFFKAHFYQDPVCPGSLGLESFLQLLNVVAWERWGHAIAARSFKPGPAATPEARFTALPLAKPHRWLYRGQIVPQNQLVTVQAVVTARDEAQGIVQADGYLSVDGRVIYQMSDFAVSLASAR